MPLNMRCRFAPNDHGLFDNAVRLQQHYLAEHADVYSAPVPRTCPDCGRQVGATGLASHRRNMHGVEPVRSGRPPNESTGRQKLSNGPFRCDLCGKTYGNRDTARHHLRDMHGNPGQWRDFVTAIDGTSTTSLATVDRVRHDPRVAWDVDDVVLPVVEQLASPGGMIPVAHLAAILAWRDATAVMLTAVSARG